MSREAKKKKADEPLDSRKKGRKRAAQFQAIMERGHKLGYNIGNPDRPRGLKASLKALAHEATV